MRKVGFLQFNKGKIKISLAIISIAFALLLSSVFVFEKINYENKFVTPINAQNCGSGTFTWHNCTACYKVGSCGGSLTYMWWKLNIYMWFHMSKSFLWCKSLLL